MPADIASPPNARAVLADVSRSAVDRAGSHCDMDGSKSCPGGCLPSVIQLQSQSSPRHKRP